MTSGIPSIIDQSIRAHAMRPCTCLLHAHARTPQLLLPSQLVPRARQFSVLRLFLCCQPIGGFFFFFECNDVDVIHTNQVQSLSRWIWVPISYIIQSHMVGPRLIQLLFSSPAYFRKLDCFLTCISVLNVHLILSCLMVLAAELSGQKNTCCVSTAPARRILGAVYS